MNDSLVIQSISDIKFNPYFIPTYHVNYIQCLFSQFHSKEVILCSLIVEYVFDSSIISRFT